MTKFYYLITFIFLVTAFGYVAPCKAQSSTTSEKLADPKINRENYYEFYQLGGAEPITTSWLKRNEAVPVIVDELNKLGYKTNEYILYELEDGNNILLDVYNRENDLGIIFNTGHLAQVSKEQRNIRTFNQNKFKYTGSLGKRKVHNDLPANIIVLQETWYWYQHREGKPNGSILNKTTAEQILRQDIRAFIEAFKKGKS